MEKRKFVAMLVLFLGVEIATAALDLGITLPKCTERSQQNQGHSYSVRYEDGPKYWSHCGFPSPKEQQTRCGRPFDRNQEYFFCDPDYLVNASNAEALDSLMYAFSKDSPYQCVNEVNVKENFTFTITVIQNLQVPDLAYNGTCINSCNEIYPELDEDTRNATDEERQLALKVFSEGLLLNLGNTQCQNNIMVIYWAAQHLIYTATGDNVKASVTDEEIANLELYALDVLAKTVNYTEAFTPFIEQVESTLIGFFTPAMTLIIILGCVLLIITISVIIALAADVSVGGHFDEDLLSQGMHYFLYTFTGIFLLEMLLFNMVKVERKMKYWHPVIPLVLFLIGGVGVVVYTVIGNSSSSATNSTATV